MTKSGSRHISIEWTLTNLSIHESFTFAVGATNF